MTAARATLLLSFGMCCALGQDGYPIFSPYDNIFRRDVAGQVFSWDLNQLCNGTDYSINDGRVHTTYLNFCQNASKACALEYPAYSSHGVAVQFFDWPTPPCYTAAPQCTDYDFDVPICCTSQCYVLVGAA